MKHKQLVNMLEDVGHYCHLARNCKHYRATSLTALKQARDNLRSAYVYLCKNNLIQENTWRDVYNFQKIMYEYGRSEHLKRFHK